MNCPKALELIKESQELHSKALVQIHLFAETHFRMRAVNDLNIFTELRKINTEYERLKKQIKVNLKEIKEEVLNIFEIDTTMPFKLPVWATELVDHDSSLGIIEWNKEKFKDALYQSPDQETRDTIKGGVFFNEIEEQEIPVLNAAVLDWLMEHQDQIPDEWKERIDGSIKHIVFGGSIFNTFSGVFCVRSLFWLNDQWQLGVHKVNDDWNWNDFEAVLSR